MDDFNYIEWPELAHAIESGSINCYDSEESALAAGGPYSMTDALMFKLKNRHVWLCVDYVDEEDWYGDISAIAALNIDNSYGIDAVDSKIFYRNIPEKTTYHNNISLRDRFAMAALTGLLVNGGNINDVVTKAFLIADKALKERCINE